MGFFSTNAQNELDIIISKLPKDGIRKIQVDWIEFGDTEWSEIKPKIVVEYFETQPNVELVELKSSEAPKLLAGSSLTEWMEANPVEELKEMPSSRTFPWSERITAERHILNNRSHKIVAFGGKFYAVHITQEG